MGLSLPKQHITKSDYIEYWQVSAEKSWQAAQHLFEKEDFVESLFFAHLTIEKASKARWVADNTPDFPPRTHNLRILAEQTTLLISPRQLAFMEQMNTFQMEGRYPDYRFGIYQMFQEPQTKIVLQETENLYQWLLNNLP